MTVAAVASHTSPEWTMAGCCESQGSKCWLCNVSFKLFPDFCARGFFFFFFLHMTLSYLWSGFPSGSIRGTTNETYIFGFGAARVGKTQHLYKQKYT